MTPLLCKTGESTTRLQAGNARRASCFSTAAVSIYFSFLFQNRDTEVFTIFPNSRSVYSTHTLIHMCAVYRTAIHSLVYPSRAVPCFTCSLKSLHSFTCVSYSVHGFGHISLAHLSFPVLRTRSHIDSFTDSLPPSSLPPSLPPSFIHSLTHQHNSLNSLTQLNSTQLTQLNSTQLKSLTH